MTSVAVGSVADAPGASTLAIGLATRWPSSERRAVLVEADADGGRLGTRLGVGVEPGLMSLALTLRSGVVDALDVAAAAAEVGPWLLLPSPPSAEQTHSALLYAASKLAATISSDGARGWILDVGRVSPRSPALPLATSADAVLVVSRGDLAALQLLPSRLDVLRASGCRRLSIVVVGPTPWELDEIAAFVGCDVAAHLPSVAGGAASAAMSGRRWRDWWRAVDNLSALVAGEPAEVPS